MHNLEEDIVQKTVQVKKQFQFGQITCTYTNTEIMNKNYSCHQSSKIKIHNNLCQHVDDSLCKKTQIIMEGKTIIIEDYYQFNVKNDQKFEKHNQNTNSSDGNSAKGSENKGEVRKKKLIFKKKGFQELKYNDKRNTKNVTKNFWQEQMIKMCQRMKVLGKNYNFSNRIIIEISEDQQLKPLFRFFLLNKAKDWIQSSRINDKQTHMQAIQLYLKIVEKKMKEFRQFESSEEEVYYQDDEDDKNDSE